MFFFLLASLSGSADKRHERIGTGSGPGPFGQREESRSSRDSSSSYAMIAAPFLRTANRVGCAFKAFLRILVPFGGVGCAFEAIFVHSACKMQMIIRETELK